jgi:AcrR family transcriptional regulator
LVVRTRHTARRDEILEAAAEVLASREGASVGDVAVAAGISRGTLYRYFPTRESLFAALEAAADEEARVRLAEANLDRVSVDEGLARATRALVAVGEHFIVLLRERRPPEPSFSEPLAALLQRGQADGEISSDCPVEVLVEALLVLVGVCTRTGRAIGMGAEDISATALRLFLDGARVHSGG